MSSGKEDVGITAGVVTELGVGIGTLGRLCKTSRVVSRREEGTSVSTCLG